MNSRCRLQIVSLRIPTTCSRPSMSFDANAETVEDVADVGIQEDNLNFKDLLSQFQVCSTHHEAFIQQTNYEF